MGGYSSAGDRTRNKRKCERGSCCDDGSASGGGEPVWVNPEPFSGGQETENDTELRSRVMNSFQRLPNGANKAYYEQEAMSFEQVAAVSAPPRKRGIGTVDVVVAETGGIPTEALLEKLQQHFEERREIAVDVVVRTPNPGGKYRSALQVAAVAGGRDAGNTTAGERHRYWMVQWRTAG